MLHHRQLDFRPVCTPGQRLIVGNFLCQYSVFCQSNLLFVFCAFMLHSLVVVLTGGPYLFVYGDITHIEVTEVSVRIPFVIKEYILVRLHSK